MISYSIFHKDHIPGEMLNKHSKPALYIGGMLALFCEDYETATGQAFTGETIDIGQGGWNPDGSAEGDGMTPEQLQNLITDMLTWPPTGKQIVLPKPMGRWLYYNDDRFKPQVSD